MRARALALALVLAGLWSPAPAALAWTLLAALAGVGLTALAARPPTRVELVRALTVIGGMAVVLAAAAALRYPLAAALDRAGLDGATLVERGLARGALAVMVAAGVIGLTLIAARQASPALAALAGLVAVAEVAIAGHGAVPRMARPDRPVMAVAGADVIRVFRNARPPLADEADGVDRAGRVAESSSIAWPPPPARRGRSPRSRPAIRRGSRSRSGGRGHQRGGPQPDRSLAVARAVVPTSIAVPADLPVVARRGEDALVEAAPARTPAFWTTRWRHADDATTLAALARPPARRWRRCRWSTSRPPARRPPTTTTAARCARARSRAPGPAASRWPATSPWPATRCCSRPGRRAGPRPSTAGPPPSSAPSSSPARSRCRPAPTPSRCATARRAWGSAR